MNSIHQMARRQLKKIVTILSREGLMKIAQKFISGANVHTQP
jgi:hypothetical protein